MINRLKIALGFVTDVFSSIAVVVVIMLTFIINSWLGGVVCFLFVIGYVLTTSSFSLTISVNTGSEDEETKEASHD